MQRGDASRSRARLAVPLAVALVTGLLIATAQSASTAPRSFGKVDARVVQQLKATGTANVLIVLRQSANLSRAKHIKNWTARGQFVVRQLKSVANTSQRGLRAYLAAHHLPYQAFWIMNSIAVAKVPTASVSAMAARPEVKRVLPQLSVPLERGIPSATPDIRVAAVEWGIKNIGANRVWKKFGDRGQGTVVSSIDTGVQYTHPALVKQYRGNLGGGSFDHNYNWWDPSHVCSGTGATPCDNNGHGTHTMGTMVGKDGTNKIGVAPKAKWIAAKGCETNSCSVNALLSSGQFILAPTRTDGSQPKPALRPDVVNNSWSGSSTDTFYQSTVNAWVAAGIFPQFANGNSGPSCGSAGAPGDFANTYSAGAYDISNTIASFSSRGPSAQGGGIKPNVSAPGVDVRSSLPTNTYGTLSGTSMASPHVAGTVALIISANPALRGNISGLRSLLDTTATDKSDLSCGGTAGNNNVYGQGRLNAFAAVGAAKAARKS
jgi:subtilisin family serine protease